MASDPDLSGERSNLIVEESRNDAEMNMSVLGRHLRKLIVAIAGTTVLVIGIFMIILPGPAIVLIPLGLGILALEFSWARRLWDRLLSFFKKDK